MESIRIQNLRSIEDSGVIPIKDINILVGQNSSGKSSFLRTFPLLRQSIIRNTRGPILWYDDSLVDFGSYEESITRNCTKSEGIKFCYDLIIDDSLNFRFRHYGSASIINSGTKLSIEIEIFEAKKINFIKKITVKIEDQIITIESNSDGVVKDFSINNQSMLNYEINANLYKQEFTGIIPNLYISTKSRSENNIELKSNTSYFRNKCLDCIKKQIGGRLTNFDRIILLIGSISISSKKDILAQLERKSNIATWNKKVSKWNIYSSEFSEINNYLLAFKVPALLRIIDEQFKSYFGE